MRIAAEPKVMEEPRPEWQSWLLSRVCRNSYFWRRMVSGGRVVSPIGDISERSKVREGRLDSRLTGCCDKSGFHRHLKPRRHRYPDWSNRCPPSQPRPCLTDS